MAVEGLAQQLIGVHAMAALLLKQPALAIDESEGKKLATALKALAAQYNIVPNPKLMAWLQLLGVSAAIYGPRIVIIAADAKKARAARQSQNVGPVSVTPSNQPDINIPTGTMKFS